jgi:transposase
MELLLERVAGLDVHRDTVVACARFPRPSGHGRASQTREFMTTQSELALLRAWLSDLAITDVAMEATGVYWVPVFSALEDNFNVVLVNAAHMKNVPGRKTDMADAAWIAQLLEHGLLQPSFVPPADIRQLRSLTRYRRALVNERTRTVQRLEKALQDAGVKLTSVASTVLSKSGRAIVEALVAGVRDPAVLAELAKGRLRPKVPQLRDALAGNFDQRHAAIVAECLAHIDGIDASVVHISAEVALVLEPHRWAIELLVSIPGVELRTAEVIIAEIGSDMSVFPTAGHLASWAGLCPGNHSSAGKSTKGTTRPGSPWLQKALTEAALSAAHSHSSYLAVRHARIRARRGKQRAAVATAHVILVATWHMLTNQVPFAELGPDYYQRHRDPEAEAKRLMRRLEALGHKVVLGPAA